MSVIKSPD